MVDEVQCGLGRTGKWFVYQHAGIQPDVALLAKGLASGVPIGACLAHGAAAKVFKPGTHGSTFGGNPLACAAALATLAAIEEEGLMKKDRKSTRLNSSHSQISYAVFCLKKKKKNHRLTNHPILTLLHTQRFRQRSHDRPFALQP